LHRIYLHVHETWKGRFARARARTAVAWFETKFRIKFRIIFQNICITFPLCSREHVSSILESIAASALVAGRTFSLRRRSNKQMISRFRAQLLEACRSELSAATCLWPQAETPILLVLLYNTLFIIDSIITV
jgi:hypothetical protein